MHYFKTPLRRRWSKGRDELFIFWRKLSWTTWSSFRWCSFSWSRGFRRNPWCGWNVALALCSWRWRRCDRWNSCRGCWVRVWFSQGKSRDFTLACSSYWTSEELSSYECKYDYWNVPPTGATLLVSMANRWGIYQTGTFVNPLEEQEQETQMIIQTSSLWF